MLISHPRGHYQFYPGIDPYSCGVVADPGFEIVHVTLRKLLPWLEGFERVRRYLDLAGRDEFALCAMELRSPAPFTMGGFIEFNRDYCGVLKDWGLYVDGLNPIARTNVAPVIDPPLTPSLHAFSYTRAAPGQAWRSFVVAGAGELRDGILEPERIIRSGETTSEAMMEKAAYVMQVMEQRLESLNGSWNLVTAVNVYTAHPIKSLFEATILPQMGGISNRAVHWLPARPPILDIEFEMDLRGVCSEEFD